MTARRVFVVCEDASASSFAAAQARRQVALLTRRGHRAAFLAARVEPRLRGEVGALERGIAEASTADVAWVMHYDRWSDATLDGLMRARGPRALWFHGFPSPERLDRGDPEWERSLRARRAMPALVDGWDLVLADSEPDRRLLERLGARGAVVGGALLEYPGAQATTGRPAPTVLCPGPVRAGRGLESAVTAMALVNRLHRPDARLVISGSARGHERFVAGLTALAGRVGVGGRMGVSDGPEDAAVPAALALDLSPEGRFPAGTVAAMLRGCPAIVVAGGPAAEVAGAGALVLPSADPPLVAEAVAEVLANAPLRARLASEARAAAAPYAGDEAEHRVAAALAPLLAGGAASA